MWVRGLARVGWASNPWLLAAIVLNLAFHAAVVYVPALQHAFGTRALGLGHWALALGLALPVFLVPEAGKAWRSRSRRGGGRGAA